MAREVISSGNALVAKAAVECGCKFFGGYPITPSSEIAEDLSKLLPKFGGKFIQMEDENCCGTAYGYRMRWVRTEMRSKGLINNTKRGI